MAWWPRKRTWIILGRQWIAAKSGAHLLIDVPYRLMMFAIVRTCHYDKYPKDTLLPVTLSLMPCEDKATNAAPFHAEIPCAH